MSSDPPAPRATPRPRLLYLGHNLPYPPHEGALIRSYHTVRILSEAFDVTGFYFYRAGASPTPEDRDRALEQMRKLGEAEAFPIPQETSAARLVWDHLRSMLTQTAYTRWMYESRAVRDLLSQHVGSRSFDLVHVDSLDLMAYLPRLPTVPTVVVHHNVESALLKRRAEPERGLRRAYIRRQARLVEKAERRWCPRVDLNVVVSAADRALLSQRAPGARFVVVPNGVDTDSFRPGGGDPEGGIAFVGGYSWFPNRDGMEFFIRDVLPLIRREAPKAPVCWIGRMPAAEATRFSAMGIDALGYVDDVRPPLRDARCVIVPLRVGGGTRLKILDAWAMGKAVVSTTTGCEGLEVRHGENILIADTPEDLATQVLAVLKDRELRERLGTAGRETAVQFYDWRVLGRTVIPSYRNLLVGGGSAPDPP